MKNVHFYVKLVFAFILQFIDKNKRTSTYYAFKNELSRNLSSLRWRVLVFEEEVRLHRYISNTKYCRDVPNEIPLSEKDHFLWRQEIQCN